MPVATMVSNTLGLNPVIESLGLQNNSATVPVGTLVSQLNLAFTAATQANDGTKTQGTRTIQIATHLTGTFESGTHSGIYAIAYDDLTSPGTAVHVFGIVGRAYNTASGSVTDGAGGGFLSGIYGSCEVDAGTVDNACSIYGNGITLTGGTVTNYFGGYLGETSAAPTGGTITNSFGLFVQMPTHGGTNNCGIQIGPGPTGVNAGFYNNSTSVFIDKMQFTPAVTLTSGTYHGLELTGTYTPGGASTLAATHLYVSPTYNANQTLGQLTSLGSFPVNSGGNTITNMWGLATGLNLSNNSTVTNGYGMQINSPTIAAGSKIPTSSIGLFIQSQYGSNANTDTNGGYTCYSARIDLAKQGGNTSGTNNNYGIYAASGTGGASGSGGTVFNYAIIAAVPNPVGAGTDNNFGIAITGAGGSGGTTNNWALYCSSTCNSIFAAPVAFGTTTAPAYVVDITGVASATAAQVAIRQQATDTITGGVTDAYTAGQRFSPTINAASALTVTRLNYMDLNNVVLGGAGPAAVTDAAVFRFDAAAGTHKAVDGATTKTTPGTVNAWVKVNVNGTIYYIPAYTSKTS